MVKEKDDGLALFWKKEVS